MPSHFASPMRRAMTLIAPLMPLLVTLVVQGRRWQAGMTAAVSLD